MYKYIALTIQIIIFLSNNDKSAFFFSFFKKFAVALSRRKRWGGDLREWIMQMAIPIEIVYEMYTSFCCVCVCYFFFLPSHQSRTIGTEMAITAAQQSCSWKIFKWFIFVKKIIKSKNYKKKSSWGHLLFMEMTLFLQSREKKVHINPW